MGVENQQQNNNEAFKSNDILYVISKEIHELTDAKKDNNNIDFKQLDDKINKNFENELQKALKNKPLILNQLLTTCKGYIENNPNHGDSELENLYKILENINNSRTSSESETESVSETQNTSETKDITLSKEQAEIQQNKIKVTLRGEWSEKSWKEKKGITRAELTTEEKQEYNTFLGAEKQKITGQLNSYGKIWDTLNDDQKTVLILAKHALESTSHDDGQGNPVSGEVLVLEKKLNELGYMPEIPNNGNNGIDGKFGTETYNALIKYLDGTSNENSGASNSKDKEIDTNNNTSKDIPQANEEKKENSKNTNSSEAPQQFTENSSTTSPEQTNTPSSTAETGGKQKKNDPFERVTNVIDRLSDFEWEKGGGFFNNMKNLLATFGGKGFEGMLQKNPNIENDNTVLNILSEVKKASKICGLDYIKDIIKNGGSNEIKKLQFNLWTPENSKADNPLKITGKIDTATAAALKYYIDNKDNTGKSDEPLKRPILTMRYEAQSQTIIKLNNVEVEGTLYKKASGSSVDGYIFEGKNQKFITADIEETDGNLTLKNSATIQYADGTKEVGEFDNKLNLTKGYRISADGEEIAIPKQSDTSADNGNSTTSIDNGENPQEATSIVAGATTKDTQINT